MSSSRPDCASASSRRVTSDQPGIHPRLPAVLSRHRQRAWARPPAAHAADALTAIEGARAVHGGAVVLDSGCGNGEATLALARAHPGRLVVGIDKSAARLARVPRGDVSNLLFVRADVVDIWRAARQRGWAVAAHYLLYPNPWPKQRHLMRRWHGHPAFDDLVALGGRLELRTNWATYAEEFAFALADWCAREVAVRTWRPTVATSAFERKYLASGHALHRVVAELPRLGS